ncbi:DUF2019 domain-containing protein [Clostridium estertheticum]|uniref:DUF2019 domain-containing protein n=1 Tax=Clostridium estertheticum TaxID=238834 RepID=UPI001CF4A437|nr:DUF2019 domain-containing protein [Clostridium estertheticum]MCB2362399.1 DUF2019 domain-containing protein [Clostridium estertheticum]
MEEKEVIKNFIEATVRNGEALSQGNSSLANIEFDKIKIIYNELKNNNKLDLLSSLLNYSNNNVRLKVATYLLPIKTEEAKQVLSELCTKTGIIKIFAKATLKEWERGNLKL